VSVADLVVSMVVPVVGAETPGVDCILVLSSDDPVAGCGVSQAAIPTISMIRNKKLFIMFLFY